MFQTHPVAAVKNDHQTTIRIRTRRGPMRSASQPPGISNSAYAQPKMENAHPIWMAVRPNSLRIAGAACAIHTRSMYMMIASVIANAIVTYRARVGRTSAAGAT
jgi:hypothetical protein